MACGRVQSARARTVCARMRSACAWIARVVRMQVRARAGNARTDGARARAECARTDGARAQAKRVRMDSARGAHAKCVR
eukprot:4600432-Pleurochrysis_carterae.AAC.1